MADEPAKKKRRVRNPETFRERASKAAEASGQPQPSRLKKVTGPVVSRTARPLSSGFRRLFETRALGWLKPPLRLIGKIIFPAYFRNSWRELKLVTWPSWRESRRLTFAVLIFAIVFGAAIAVVDFGLDKAFRAILLK